MGLVSLGDGIYQVLDRMLEVEDQLVVSSESVQRVAVAEVVEHLEDPLRTLDPEQNFGSLVDLFRVGSSGVVAIDLEKHVPAYSRLQLTMDKFKFELYAEMRALG